MEDKGSSRMKDWRHGQHLVLLLPLLVSAYAEIERSVINYARYWWTWWDHGELKGENFEFHSA